MSNAILNTLIIWCVTIVVFACWGLAIMNTKCENYSLFTRLRVMLILGAVGATVLFCYRMCLNYCHDEFSEIHWFVPAICITIAMGVFYVLFISHKNSKGIYSAIADCTSNPSNWKMYTLVICLPFTLGALAYGIYIISLLLFTEYETGQRIKSVKEAEREKREKEKELKELEEQTLAEEKRLAELLKAENAQRKAEELKERMEKIEAEKKQMVAEREKKERKKREAEEDAKIEVEMKELKLPSAEEIVRKTKEKAKAKRIAKVSEKIDSLKKQIKEASEDGREEMVIEKGNELERARSELESIKSQEYRGYGSGGYGGYGLGGYGGMGPGGYGGPGLFSGLESEVG